MHAGDDYHGDGASAGVRRSPGKYKQTAMNALQPSKSPLRGGPPICGRYLHVSAADIRRYQSLIPERNRCKFFNGRGSKLRLTTTVQHVPIRPTTKGGKRATGLCCVMCQTSTNTVCSVCQVPLHTRLAFGSDTCFYAFHEPGELEVKNIRETRKKTLHSVYIPADTSTNPDNALVSSNSAASVARDTKRCHQTGESSHANSTVQRDRADFSSASSGEKSKKRRRKLRLKDRQATPED